MQSVIMSPDSQSSADRNDAVQQQQITSPAPSYSDAPPLVVRRRISRNSSLSFSRESVSSSASHQTVSNDYSSVRSVERSNISCLMRLIVKHLLETAMRQNRVVEANELPLVNFFVTFESLMAHGLKPRKNLLGVSSGRDFWPVLEMVQALRPDAVELTKSVRDLPHIRTGAGRSRAWIRMAFVQKKLSEYFQALTDRKDLLKEFYDDDSFIMSEDVVPVGGLLIGLNVIECNQWCPRDERLDMLTNVVDLRYYFRSALSPNESIDEPDESDQMKELLDQKNYLEELNRNLTSTVTSLKQKLSQALDNKFELLPNSDPSPVIPNGSSASNASNTPPASEFDDAEQRYKKEIDALTHANSEMETAMKLLEKDVHEKQDTIISIRRQLEDIKAINIQMFHKIKQLETDVKEKDNKFVKSEQKIASCLKTIAQLEAKLKTTEEKRTVLEDVKQHQEQQIKELESERLSDVNDLKLERERSSSLQKLLDDQHSEIARLSTELDEAKQNLNEYNRLRAEYLVLQKKCSEYELSLEEVGGQLKESTLQVDDLKESSMHLREAFWMKDSEASECFRCEEPFSLSRRKHHCRNCGRIFCSNCSDNKMPLASSEKPVRVCDRCRDILLERCSVK